MKIGKPAWTNQYLVAYNVLSAIGWAYILLSLLIHIFNLDGRAALLESSVGGSASSKLSRYLPFFRSSRASVSYVESRLPSFLQPVFRRFSTSFLRVGTITAFVQTCALLEVAHSALGWVRSPIATTAMQVASRLYAVWGVVETFPETRSNPLYTTMVLAWCLAEIIRYSFYAANLLGYEPYPLLYLRYTAFYILYPLGASSEAFLNYATLPASSPIPSWAAWAKGMWKPTDYLRGALFLIWWPCEFFGTRLKPIADGDSLALYFLMAYMSSQRRKVLRKAKGTKAN